MYIRAIANDTEAADAAARGCARSPSRVASLEATAVGHLRSGDDEDDVDDVVLLLLLAMKPWSRSAASRIDSMRSRITVRMT